MKANKTRISLITLILTVALMFSLFSIGVFAESASATSTSAPAESTAAASTSAPASSSSAASSGTSTSAGTASGTAGANAEGKDLTGTIISLSILGVIVVVIAIICIIKREKVGKFFRSLKSETKKVVWLPWNQVRKNSIVVIIIVVIVSVVIGLLDFAFSQGIINLGTLFNK